MRRAPLAAAVALLLLPWGGVAAQDLSRADPALRFLLTHPGLVAAEPGLEAAPVVPGAPHLRAPADPRVPSPLMGALQEGAAGPVVRTLVRLGPDGEAALRRAGAEIGTRAGEIVTARVPLSAFPDILSEPGIRAMEAATALRPDLMVPAGPPPPSSAALNDSAAADAGFDALRQLAGERWEGLAGQGVIVGVYDSGLDLDHPDFLRPDGGTRVLFAWDQTVPGSPPGVVGGSVFDYGTECTAGSIDDGSCPMEDRIGHGTHVAGVAAGDGSATSADLPAFRFPGGAPRADLIVVKGGDGTFTADLLVDGVAYIFGRAAALGRPAVVNVSLSSQSGPHDGTTLMEEALDALSGPGRVVVSGTGNSGDHRNSNPPVRNGPNHAQGIAGGAGHAVVIPPYAPFPGAANDGVLVELWYDGADSLAITMRSPRGEAVTALTGDSASLETAGGAFSVMNAVDGPAPGNGDHAALLAILDYDASAPPDTGRWAIEVTPQAVHAGGEYHLWLTGYTLDAGELPALAGGTTNRYLVGVPASADRVLATGGHVTRHRWTGLDGEIETFPTREELGDIAYFSSPGPRRDGVQKPDVTAPSKILMSSLSSEATLWDGLEWLIEQDSMHVGLLGTSMASPQLAAAVAILLQLEPDLTPEEAREVLRLSATVDAFVPQALPHPVWGAGKLNAAAAAERLRPDGIAGPDQDVSLSANPVRGDGLVISYAERPRSVAVYTLIAERVRGLDAAEIGPLSAVWPLDTDAGGDVANGAYVLVVEFENRRVLRKLLVARP